MKKYNVTDIDYDTDGENVDLPKTLIIEVPNDLTTNIEVNDYIGDKITEMTDFAHFGFSATVIK